MISTLNRIYFSCSCPQSSRRSIQSFSQILIAVQKKESVFIYTKVLCIILLTSDDPRSSERLIYLWEKRFVLKWNQSYDSMSIPLFGTFTSYETLDKKIYLIRLTHMKKNKTNLKKRYRQKIQGVKESDWHEKDVNYKIRCISQHWYLLFILAVNLREEKDGTKGVICLGHFEERSHKHNTDIMLWI